ncbi:MAG: hypothetical protein M1834_004861 [Cirrosporium novae-zelandiae]|nr:MAG: hypothetical protein M1834_004861 [Cirrosporium novae-zelandiae]
MKPQTLLLLSSLSVLSNALALPQDPRSTLFDCGTTFCLAIYKYLHDPTTGKCCCAPLDAIDCYGTTLSTKATTTNTTSATIKERDPAPAPQWTTTAECMQERCPLDGSRKVWDATSESCQCISEITPSKRAPLPLPLPEQDLETRDPMNCSELRIYCEYGPDHKAVYDPESDSCICPEEASSSLSFRSPVASSNPNSCCAFEVFCLSTSDGCLTLVEGSDTCTCPPVATLKPRSALVAPRAESPETCALLKIYCSEGPDGHAVWDETLGRCVCPAGGV